MSTSIALAPSLYLVDASVPPRGVVDRLRPTPKNKVASTLLADERATPFVGAHGLSMLVRITRGDITRSVLFDTGGSIDGLVHNLDCLELSPRDWNCIVLSHGHLDHVLGLIGLEKPQTPGISAYAPSGCVPLSWCTDAERNHGADWRPVAPGDA